jgi:hypothetical protein
MKISLLRSIQSSVLLAICALSLSAQGLQIKYSASGLQSVAYNGVVLEDVNQNPGDALHIWHMKVTDLSGNPLNQYGWGESNRGKTWDPVQHASTYLFDWGSIRVQYFQATPDILGVRFTTTNNLNSGVIVDGATVYPLVFHFPRLPAGFVNSSYPQIQTNTTGPSVTLADYGSGEVAAVYDPSTTPLYTGFDPAGGNNYTALVSTTTPDSVASFTPRFDRPVKPGQSDLVTVLWHFAPSGTDIAKVAGNAFTNWARTWVSTLNWPDRRIIGSVYLASSPSGDPSRSGSYPNNPRRYFNDSNANDFDIRTSAGLAQFQAKILQQAQNNVQNLQYLHAQGAITWDIEGEQYPQTTSYVCSPDQIAKAAPEVESIITDPSSPYVGTKLDDAYFRIMRNAGFRVGVCVRPQHFSINPDGTAGQTYLTDSQVVSELVRKMKYAHDRWGATLFYLDSTVEANGGNIPFTVFQKAAASLPDSLLIPEETTPAYYGYTAAFQSFIFRTDLGTPSVVYNYYPKAFSVNLVNDVDFNKLTQYRAQLTQAVKRGDILVVHADYWQQNNPLVLQIYADAASMP